MAAGIGLPLHVFLEFGSRKRGRITRDLDNLDPRVARHIAEEYR